MSKQTLPAPAVKSHFPNPSAAALWGALAFVGFLVLVMRYRGVQGVVGGAVGLFALQASFCFAIGVRIGSDHMTLPRPILRKTPLLVLWRASVALTTLQDVTAAGKVLGLDLVVLTTPDGDIETLFASRRQRLAFFESIRSRLPKIKIYRVY